uniref:Uncharacterized protein n=1 Tax=Eptatretus burgeri TaxID=7764 RepID=A0A8C4WXD7_EPTBU
MTFFAVRLGVLVFLGLLVVILWEDRAVGAALGRPIKPREGASPEAMAKYMVALRQYLNLLTRQSKNCVIQDIVVKMSHLEWKSLHSKWIFAPLTCTR